MRAEPVPARLEQLALHRADDPVGRRGQASMALELKGGERQALVLSAEALQLTPQQFTAVEVMQTRIGLDQATGRLGVVLFGHSDETRRSHCR